MEATGVHEYFKYLCVAESHLQNAISRSGATGFWQFMKNTFPEYALQITSTVDGRYNLIKSTDAACQYLKQAYAKFSSCTAAAASYTCGMGGYQQAASFQRTKNYYDLLLPEETQRYIFRMLALKFILENADELGFKIEDKNLYKFPATRSVTISQSIPELAVFAIENGTIYKMMRWLNPWLRSRSLTVTGENLT